MLLNLLKLAIWPGMWFLSADVARVLEKDVCLLVWGQRVSVSAGHTVWERWSRLPDPDALRVCLLLRGSETSSWDYGRTLSPLRPTSLCVTCLALLRGS